MPFTRSRRAVVRRRQSSQHGRRPGSTARSSLCRHKPAARGQQFSDYWATELIAFRPHLARATAIRRRLTKGRDPLRRSPSSSAMTARRRERQFPKFSSDVAVEVDARPARGRLRDFSARRRSIERRQCSKQRSFAGRVRNGSARSVPSFTPRSASLAMTIRGERRT